MNTIRTAEELARLLASTSDPELQAILTGHQLRLSAYADFAFEELAIILLAEPCDTLANLLAAGGAGEDTIPELVIHHQRWLEATFLLSDDGFGLILLVDHTESANAELLTAINTLADDMP